MTGPVRRPIFGFVFATRGDRPGAPQLRWIRVPARGPWRLALLILATLAVASVTGTALLTLAAARSGAGLGIAALALVVVLPAIGLLVRAWVIGTYVNDSGVRNVGWWGSHFLSWPTVLEVRTRITRTGQRVVVCTDAGDVDTRIGSRDLDTALRPQAWDAAVDRLRTWHRETR